MEPITIKDAREFEVMTLDNHVVTLCGNLIAVNPRMDPSHNPIYLAIAERLDHISRVMFEDYIQNKFNGSKKSFEVSLQYKDIRIEMKRWYRIVETDAELIIYRKCSLDSNKLVKVCGSRSRQVYSNLLHDFEIKVNSRATNGLPKTKLEISVKEIVCDPECILRIPDNITKYTNDRMEYTYCFWDLDGFLFRHQSDPTPAWDSFLSSFALNIERELFLAFIYSVFKSDDRGRQILWVHGKGKSGKSTVYNVISDVMSQINPDLVTAIPDKGQIDKFTFGNADKWRLAVIPNCVDQSLLKNNDIIKLTGGDRYQMRKMYADSQSGEVHCKFIVASNYAPIVDEVDHEMSRIIYLQMDNELTSAAFIRWSQEHPDKVWRQELLAEFPAILAKGKELYYRRGFRTSEGNFYVPDELFDKLRKIHDSDLARKMSWFIEYCCEKNEMERGVTGYQFMGLFAKWLGINYTLFHMAPTLKRLLNAHDYGWNYTNIKGKQTLICRTLVIKPKIPHFSQWYEEFKEKLDISKKGNEDAE